MSDVVPRDINWMWPDRLAKGKLNFLAGPADQGKSLSICDIVARVTTGRDWPDGTKNTNGPQSVIMLSAEDEAEDTIYPRLLAAGADLDKVLEVKMLVIGHDESGERMLDVSKDLQRLSQMAAKICDVGLVTVDPINSYMGAGGKNGTDTYRTSEVRAVLSPLGAFAHEHKLCLLYLSHMTKNAKGSPLDRMLDSHAFTAIARTGWYIVPEMRDGIPTGRRLFVVAKKNIGKPVTGLTYEIEAVAVEGFSHEQPRVKWGESTNMTAAQALAQMDSGGEKQKGTVTDAATTFLEDLLAAGPMDSKEIRGKADDAGHNWRTVQRAAGAEYLNVVKERDGFGPATQTTWRLRTAVDDFDDDFSEAAE